MTQAAKSQEPSMEEILASIRRIIADDDAGKSGRESEPPKAASRAVPPSPSVPYPARAEPSVASSAAVGPGAEVDDQTSDILDLTESMAAPMPNEPTSVSAPSSMLGPAPQFRRIDGNSDVSFDEAGERPNMQKTIEGARHQFARESGERGDDERGKLLSSETSAAVDSAFNTLAQTVLVQNARTLEDLVREMLRPLLKTWLDDNLPAMVERLVRAEIERVARGRVG
jgi:uncharacterized protein